jgi:DinB superfamily
MLDTAALRQAYDDLLDAARRTADPEATTAPPPGEWNPDQVLAHVSMINATTIAAAYTVASGLNATYDNRVALDTWSIQNTVALAGGTDGLRERIARQADVLCALGGPALSETELGATIPARLVSNGALVVDQVLTLRDLITGLAESEIPGHTSNCSPSWPERSCVEVTGQRPA